MATKLEIINSSLADLNAEPITSEFLEVAEIEFGEGSGEVGGETVLGIQDGLSTDYDEIAATAIAIYPSAKTHILVAHPWSFLSRRSMLQETDDSAAGTGEPWWPFTYQFKMPGNLLDAIRAVYREASGRVENRPITEGWEVSSGHVFADFRPVFAAYQGSDAPEETMPALVVNALRAEFTARMVFPVTNTIESKPYYDELAMKALDDAKRIDAQSHPVTAFTGFSYVEAHLGGF